MQSLNATLRVLEYFLLGPWRGTDTPERGGKRSPAGPQWQDTLTPELRGREGRDRWQGRGRAERLQGPSRTQIRGRRPTPAPPPARARPWAGPLGRPSARSPRHLASPLPATPPRLRGAQSTAFPAGVPPRPTETTTLAPNPTAARAVSRRHRSGRGGASGQTRPSAPAGFASA